MNKLFLSLQNNFIMRRFLLSVSIVSLVLMYSCVPPQPTAPQEIKVNYLNVSVPEEGGMSFVQYTREDEKVVGPVIRESYYTKKLQWYAAPFISISPDGEKLAYVAKSNDYFNLYIKNISGGRATIQRTFNRNILDMSFSPDGEKIAFTEQRGSVKNIYMINATSGAAVQQVTATNTDEIGPQFTKNGESIYYTKEENGRFYIWNINLKTSLLTQFSEGFTPNLTPGNGSLVITRNSKDGEGRGEIWMIDLKIGTETLILNHPEIGYSSPAIHPDGKVICVVGSTEKSDTRPQNLDIYLVNTDGTNLRQITFHGGHDVSPQWSPDGKSLFFISQRGNEKGNFNVWKIDVNV